MEGKLTLEVGKLGLGNVAITYEKCDESLREAGEGEEAAGQRSISEVGGVRRI